MIAHSSLLRGASLRSLLSSAAFVAVSCLQAANVTIPAGLAPYTLDGGVNAGETITIASGTHGPIIIKNITGTSTNRIKIQNPSSGGVAVIDGLGDPSGSNGALELIDVEYVTIDGSNNPAHQYGIRITSSVFDQGKLLHFTGLSRFSTVRFVEVDGASNGRTGVSINDQHVTLAQNPNFWREGYVFERNWIHHVLSEGMYLGHNQNSCGDNGDEACVPVRNIEVSYNLVEYTGWDGINLKDAPNGGGSNKIHHNTLRRVGIPGDNGGQDSGIALLDANADVYNNWVELIGTHGIKRAGLANGSGSIKIYNNVVIDAGQNANPGGGKGINTNNPATNVTAYNNTIVRPDGDGIVIGASTGTIRDNIVAAAGGTPWSGGGSIVRNISGTITGVGFVSASNFHLLTGSPAKDSGSTNAAEFPPTDFDGITRPQGTKSDQGAYEFVSSNSATFISIAAEDGRVREDGENTNVGGGTLVTDHYVGDNANDEQVKLILSFDTSSLPDGATIQTATLRLRRSSVTNTNPFNWGGQCRVDIRNGTFGTANLQPTDFEAAASAVNVAQMSNPTSDGAWSTGTLSSTGRAQISKTGKTQIRVYFQTDDNNNNSPDQLWFHGGEAVSGSRPELVITYQ